MRLEITRYSLLAFALVVVLAAAAAGMAALAAGWARAMVRAAPVVGALGVVATGLAAVNLAVPRGCSTDPPVRNQPLVSAIEGDACQRTALAQVQAVILLGVGTSLAVRRTSGRAPRPALAVIADQ